MTLVFKNVRLKNHEEQNEISFELNEGVWGMLSNSPKSIKSFLEILTGKRDFYGEILLNDKLISSKIHEISVISHSFSFPSMLNAKEIFSLACLLNKTSKESIENIVSITEIDEFYNLKPEQFIGEQKAKLLLAINLLTNPSLIIFNEIFTEIPKELEKRNIIFLTSNSSEIEKNTLKTLIFNENKLLKQGEIEDFLELLNRKVWEGIIGEEQIIELEKNFFLTLKTHLRNGFKARIINNSKPSEGFRNIAPTLEDVLQHLIVIDKITTSNKK